MAIETTGKTIDAAIAAALAKLNTDRDSVTVEVLENPKTGFLGLGGAPARVRVTPVGEDDQAKAPQPMPSASAVPDSPRSVAPRAPETKESRGNEASAVLTGILERMGFQGFSVRDKT